MSPPSSPSLRSVKGSPSAINCTGTHKNPSTEAVSNAACYNYWGYALSGNGSTFCRVIKKWKRHSRRVNIFCRDRQGTRHGALSIEWLEKNFTKKILIEIPRVNFDFVAWATDAGTIGRHFGTAYALVPGIGMQDPYGQEGEQSVLRLQREGP